MSSPPPLPSPLKNWKAYNCNLTGNRWRTLERLVPQRGNTLSTVVNRFTFRFFHRCSNISSAKIPPSESTHYAKRWFFSLPSPPSSWPLTFLNSALSIARISYYLSKEIQFEILGKRGKNISRWMENNLGELVFIRGIRNENFERRNFFSLFLHFVSDPCIIYCVGENKWKDCAWKKNIGYLFTKQFKFR